MMVGFTFSGWYEEVLRLRVGQIERVRVLQVLIGLGLGRVRAEVQLPGDEAALDVGLVDVAVVPVRRPVAAEDDGGGRRRAR